MSATLAKVAADLMRFAIRYPEFTKGLCDGYDEMDRKVVAGEDLDGPEIKRKRAELTAAHPEAAREFEAIEGGPRFWFTVTLDAVSAGERTRAAKTRAAAMAAWKN